MAFRLRKDTREWFKYLKKSRDQGFDLDFDMYYLCLMAGLATGRKEEVPQAETTDLVNEFPGNYRSRGRIIIALFLTREIKAMGIKMSEKRMLHSTIRGLVDPLSSSHLSDAGMKELNKYAFGGFEVLTEWFQERPRVIEAFLPLYKKYLDSVLYENL